MRLFFRSGGAGSAADGHYKLMQNAAHHRSHLSPVEDKDVVLTQRVASGDEQAARDLIRRVSGRVKNTCRYMAGPVDADDLSQLALMQVVRSAARFRGESSLARWVDSITVRTAAKQFEKRKRRQRLAEVHFEPEPLRFDTSEESALFELREQLYRHFQAISEKQRSAVVLHYVYGYEIAEIAELLDVRVNAIRSRLRKGLKQLRRRILDDPCLREWVRGGKHQ